MSITLLIGYIVDHFSYTPVFVLVGIMSPLAAALFLLIMGRIERVPAVNRVIFLATPHHGSSLSPSPAGRLLAKLVTLPKQMVNAARDVNLENPLLLSAFKNGNLPNSIDLLAPHAPALELLAARPRPARVRYHSVIGVLPYSSCLWERLLPGGSSKEGTDGVVPFTSAHLEGVESEITVPADHFHMHHHPAAVAEVRRILMEHYESLHAPEVVPASLSTGPVGK